MYQILCLVHVAVAGIPVFLVFHTIRQNTLALKNGALVTRRLEGFTLVQELPLRIPCVASGCLVEDQILPREVVTAKLDSRRVRHFCQVMLRIPALALAVVGDVVEGALVPFAERLQSAMQNPNSPTPGSMLGIGATDVTAPTALCVARLYLTQGRAPGTIRGRHTGNGASAHLLPTAAGSRAGRPLRPFTNQAPLGVARLHVALSGVGLRGVARQTPAKSGSHDGARGTLGATVTSGSALCILRPLRQGTVNRANFSVVVVGALRNAGLGTARLTTTSWLLQNCSATNLLAGATSLGASRKLAILAHVTVERAQLCVAVLRFIQGRASSAAIRCDVDGAAAGLVTKDLAGAILVLRRARSSADTPLRPCSHNTIGGARCRLASS